jgi:hypothetical protein
MIRCYCCERRYPASVDEILGPCICADDFCDRCLVCVHHCKCSGAESNPFIIIRRDTASLEDPLLP